MPAVEPRPEDLKDRILDAKPTITTEKVVPKKLETLPWQAMVPVPLQNVPMPLGPVPTPDKLTPDLLGPAVGNYAETGFRPTVAQPAVPRDKRIGTYEQTLDGANYVQQHLKGPEKEQYLEDRLKALSKFSQDVVSPSATNNVSATVPNQLIDNARPLVESLERMQPDQTMPAAGHNPEGAHVGTGTDWNTALGVPQYRTQSDNLIPPEASCNMTSLAVGLERMGYGREDAMKAIETQLKERYLEEQRQKALKAKQDPSTLPKTAEEVSLPQGYFEGRVKDYLKNVNDGADKPYQGVRGKTTDDKAWDTIAAKYHDNAQFEDTLDFLRYLTKAGARTDLDAVTPKLLEKLEPDADKRPTYRSITPDGKTNWTTARQQLNGVLDEGGAAMLSYHHKGGNNHDASHIISVQQLTKDGVIVDDPYGKPRADYNVAQVGDAYGERGQAGRSNSRKNLVDASVDRSNPHTIDADWYAAAGQGLRPDESHGNSAAVSDSVFANSWRSIRFLEPAKKKPEVPVPAQTPVVPPRQEH
jgi:hypothetical protein